MLKKLQTNGLVKLTTLINGVIMWPKPKKDHREVESIRVIALLPINHIQAMCENVFEPSQRSDRQILSGANASIWI